jgi:hypothetical protein
MDVYHLIIGALLALGVAVTILEESQQKKDE